LGIKGGKKDFAANWTCGGFEKHMWFVVGTANGHCLTMKNVLKQ
jgi:hypothetical protein